MKVMLVSPSMGVGGAERVVAELACELALRGHEVALLAPLGERDSDISSGSLTRLPLHDSRRSMVRSGRTFVEIASAVRTLQPDIVHAQNPRIAAFCAAALRLASPLGPRPPLIATCHGVTQAETRRSAHLLRAADMVVCVSEDLSRRLSAAGLSASRLAVVPNSAGLPASTNAARLAALRAELGVPPGARVAAIVARIVPEKAHHRFVRAAATAAARVADAHFLVVGDGPLREVVEAQVASCGLEGRVTFTGELSDARELIAAVDVLVFSSDSEGLSIAALEAMAAGTPVLSTDVSGMRSLLAHGAGEIVQRDDGTVLGERLAALLSDPQRCAEMGRVGIDEVCMRYSPGAMTDGYEAHYRALIEPTRATL
ncbi:MAG: glycosyltransferase family 4 protein [Solirubrobacteraceae bacterium]